MIEDRLEAIRKRLRDFTAARDWQQFHDPKNLAMAIASEAGELLSELRWTKGEDADAIVRSEEGRSRIEAEVADVAIALLLFCERSGIDLIDAVDRKIDVNERNYPIDAARGRSGRPKRT